MHASINKLSLNKTQIFMLIFFGSLYSQSYDTNRYNITSIRYIYYFSYLIRLREIVRQRLHICAKHTHADYIKIVSYSFNNLSQNSIGKVKLFAFLWEMPI